MVLIDKTDPCPALLAVPVAWPSRHQSEHHLRYLAILQPQDLCTLDLLVYRSHATQRHKDASSSFILKLTHMMVRDLAALLKVDTLHISHRLVHQRTTLLTLHISHRKIYGKAKHECLE
jgi:hypothetical protein